MSSNDGGNGWVDIPQPTGTPTAPSRFHRTLLGNNAVPIPLVHLRDGANIVQFAAGPQIAYSFGFGFYWIYDFSVRVFYAAAKPHPTGEVISPKAGATFGDTLELEARASSPNGAIARVEFIGEYDDFDWDGDSIHELRLNGERLVKHLGQFHNYGFDAIDVPLARLRPGANEISIFSEFKGHALEINWPGPVLLVAFQP